MKNGLYAVGELMIPASKPERPVRVYLMPNAEPTERWGIRCKPCLEHAAKHGYDPADRVYGINTIHGWADIETAGRVAYRHVQDHYEATLGTASRVDDSDEPGEVPFSLLVGIIRILGPEATVKPEVLDALKRVSEVGG